MTQESGDFATKLRTLLEDGSQMGGSFIFSKEQLERRVLALVEQAVTVEGYAAGDWRWHGKTTAHYDVSGSAIWLEKVTGAQKGQPLMSTATWGRYDTQPTFAHHSGNGMMQMGGEELAIHDSADGHGIVGIAHTLADYIRKASSTTVLALARALVLSETEKDARGRDLARQNTRIDNMEIENGRLRAENAGFRRELGKLSNQALARGLERLATSRETPEPVNEQAGPPVPNRATIEEMFGRAMMYAAACGFQVSVTITPPSFAPVRVDQPEPPSLARSPKWSPTTPGGREQIIKQWRKTAGLDTAVEPEPPKLRYVCQSCLVETDDMHPRYPGKYCRECVEQSESISKNLDAAMGNPV